MHNERSFYRCEICGNLVELIEDAGVKMVCCEQEMTLLVPNKVEASHEKHLPVGKLKGNELTVTVSSAIHPMTEEHHIAWIAVSQGSKIQRVALEKTVKPTATFFVGEGDITMYEYCNLHGLWTATTN